MNKRRNRGDRDWQTWAQLKGRLHEAYKNEEIFWSQKEFNGCRRVIKIPIFSCIYCAKAKNKLH